MNEHPNAEGRRRILFIATGGTLVSAYGEDGLKPHIGPDELLDRYASAKNFAAIATCHLSHLDSTNLHPRNWQAMAGVLEKEYGQYDGFVLGHGTDTLSYTAAALSFALQDIDKPVVLTGSALSTEHPQSDAERNFTNAIALEASSLVKEVCICFHGKIIKGTQAQKTKNEATVIVSENPALYSSVNAPYIGWIDPAGRVTLNEHYKPHRRERRPAKFLGGFDPNIGLIKLFPGIDSSALTAMSGRKAVVIEGFGPGNVPYAYSDWRGEIEKATSRGTHVFVTTQNPFGAVDMSMYEVGQLARKAGAISCRNMTSEAVVAKLMWIFGNQADHLSRDQMITLFNTNYAGEFYES